MSHTLEDVALRAEQAHGKIDAHEDLCLERYKRIDGGMDHLKDLIERIIKVMGWAGVTIITLLMCVLGWLVVDKISSTDDRLDRITVMERHLDDRQPAPQR